MAFGPARLYHSTCITGKVFRDESEFNAYLSQGWVDFPTKIDTVAEKMAETPCVAVPEPAQEAKPQPPRVDPPVKSKRPGRQPKKVKGGK